MLSLSSFRDLFIFFFSLAKQCKDVSRRGIRNVVDGCASLLNLDERMHFPDATAVKLHRRYFP